ncbi:carbohydrate kinase family protein [Candidatus Gottesmanbacteria bacterium]|nr:carbohydrate kinase family protein [Candidatus Gottesmanbacteria bacterium]
MIDTFVPLTEAALVTVKGEIMLGLQYGCKIPVGDSVSLVAGNAANNAVGASRLKLKTAIYVNIGSDDRGDKIKSKLKEEGVDARYVTLNENLPTNHHIVLDFKGERTILVHHQPWKYSLPDLDRTKWIYFTSLAPTFVESNIVNQLINYLEFSSARLLYNPGTFQIKMGVKKHPRLLSLTELFIVNVEEAKHILGYAAGEAIPIKKLLLLLGNLGPKMVIITNGKDGSYGFDGENCYNIGIFPANLVEMTGAGDAYATGVLAALFHGDNLAEAMRWGAANGASVVEQIGPQSGLLTYHKMQERLKEYSRIVARKI